MCVGRTCQQAVSWACEGAGEGRGLVVGDGGAEACQWAEDSGGEEGWEHAGE